MLDTLKEESGDANQHPKGSCSLTSVFVFKVWILTVNEMNSHHSKQMKLR